jgi:hypothetical protein
VIGPLLALSIVSAPPPNDASGLGARIRDSAAAAEAYQGDWDGAWVLKDAHGRRLFVLQITDPADGGPLAGAWREAGGAGRTGWLDAIERRGAGLDFTFTKPGQKTATVVHLERRAGRSAAGWMTTAWATRAVRLSGGH